MRPISRWALLGLAAMPSAGAAAREVSSASPVSATAAIAIVPGHLTGSRWLGPLTRPFSVSRLIGQAPSDGRETGSSRSLGAAPEPPRLISFARGNVVALPTSLLRDAPRFSRMPGKQVENYEVGLRSLLANEIILLQMGMSYDTFRNLQTTIRQGSRMMTASAGKAKTYGVEGLVRWSPDRRLSLFATYAWREGRLKNRVRDGRKFRLSPDRSAALGAVLTVPAGPGRIAFTPSVAWRSAMGIGTGGGTDMDGRGSGALISAQIGYGLSDSFEVEAVAANLLDRRSAISPIESGPLIAGEPRVLGVRARLRFGGGG